MGQKRNEPTEPIEQDQQLLQTTAEHKRSEDTLRESEKLFRAMFENGPMGMMLVSAKDGKLLRVNRAFCQILDYLPEEFLALGAKAITHPDDFATDTELFEEVSAGRLPGYQREKRYIRKDGGIIWGLLSVTALHDSGGEITHLLGQVIDITERKRDEAERKITEGKSEQAQMLLQTVLDSTPDWIFAKDTNHRFLFVSPAFAVSQGYTPREMAGRLDTDFWPIELCIGDPARGIRGFHVDDDAAMKGELVHNPNDPATYADGKLHIFDTLKLPLRDAAGHCYGVLGYARDVTELRMADKELRFHSEILRNLSEGILLTRVNDRKIVFTNPQFERMFGYGPDELLGKHVSTLNALGENDPEEVANTMINEIARTGVWSGEVQNIRKDGTIFWCHARVSVFEHSQFGRVWVGAHEDISERKQIEEALSKSEESYRKLFKSSRDAIMTLAADKGFLSGNAAAVALFGCRDEQEFTTLSPALTSPEFQSDERRSDEKAQEMMRTALETGSNFFEWTHRRVDGTEFEADVLLTRMEVGGKKLIQATVRDITARKQVETELRIAAIAFESHEGMIVTDANGVIIRVNNAFIQLTGYCAEEALGRTPALLSSGRYDQAFYERMWATLKEKKYWQGEIWNRRKNGKIYAEWLTISAVTAPNGNITHYVGTFSDITHDPEASAEIHRLAYYDPLTQLPNRRLFLDRLGQALASSNRTGHYGALLFLDLDNFKILNDTRGHDVGDLLLIEIAQRLSGCVREGDTVARLGGDEFVLMLENLSENNQDTAIQAGLVGEKVRNAIASPYMLREIEFICTASIGVSLFYKHAKSVDELLKHADLAMYHAKKGGRNSVRFFDPDMQAKLVERSALEADLRYALERQQLHLYYQMQVDSLRRIIGAEALLRWEHPERGLVMPAEFIHIAEEAALILSIGHWVLKSACTQIKNWSTSPATRELRLAINVSARQFHQAEFVEQVQQALIESGADPTRLKLELTESLVLEDVSKTIAKMHTLKKLGICLAMDDFGTGYSSLTYLKQLPLDELKIDRSFVRDLATDPNDAAIVQAIITMGRTFELNVISEGVETEAQFEFLDNHGSHGFQGFMFSKPVPQMEFEKQLTQCA